MVNGQDTTDRVDEDLFQVEKEDQVALVSSPLYTQVEGTYPCSLPVPGGISSSDITDFKISSSSSYQLRLTDIQQAGHTDYGSCGSSSGLSRQRSNSKASRKSNQFIDEAERLMAESFTSASSEVSQVLSESDMPF